MGNPIRPDMFDVNFEKARADMNGPYPMINREFARRIAETPYRFLNREDDMGLEGLRRAKESYIPDLLLEKLLAEAVNYQSGIDVVAAPVAAPWGRGPVGQPRNTLYCAACARGRMVIRSRLTCAGRVAMNEMVSATSSAVRGSSTPA